MQFDPAESVDSSTRVRAYKILRGHKATVLSVSAQKSGNMVCCYPLVLNLCFASETTLPYFFELTPFFFV